MQSVVQMAADVRPQALGGGVTRRVLCHLPQQMMVEVGFETGAQGAPHRHPHVQCTYVLRGRFAFTIEGERREVGPGDTLAFAPNEEHGCVCLEQGALLDVFTPQRDDFLA